MKISTNDDEKLILTRADVEVLYEYLRDCMVLPKYGIGVDKLEFMRKLWDLVSIIASPNDFQEKNAGFPMKST